MNVSDIRNLIKQGNLSAVEDAWLDGIEKSSPPETMCEVLAELTAAGFDDSAAMLAGMLLEESTKKLAAAEALRVAKAVLPAAPATDDLRLGAADLYRRACADVEAIDTYLNASGIEGRCTLRRAIAAMDICLGGSAGSYLVNPYEVGDVVRIERFDPASGQLEVIDPRGQRTRLDPPSAADDYQLACQQDWRVLTTFRAGDLVTLVADDPAGVLIGICIARGGQIDAGQLKDLLVPGYLQSSAWSGWWNRARSAIKRSDQLVIEGRNPAVIAYHPHGRTLEQELAPRVDAARTPLELHAVLTDYVRELPARKAELDPAFAGKIIETLAEQACEYRTRRPADALVAALAVEAAAAAGLPVPRRECPSAAIAVAELEDPAAAIAALTDIPLQQIALDALEQRDDAGVQLEKLFELMPTDALDDLAERCRRAGVPEAIDQAARDALTDPVKRLQVLLWLWRGPAEPVTAMAGPLELLSRVLAAGEEIARDVLIDRDFRRESFHQIRSAVTAADCARFREASEEMSEGEAATIKRRVERCDALSASTRPKLLAIIREQFYKLFLERKVEPWLDENTLWTTQASVTAHEANLKRMIEIDMPENSRRIGEAAEKGDLSENSDWQYAVEEQRRLQAKVSKLKGDLSRSRALHAGDVPADSVGIGSRVTLRRGDDGREIDISILGPWESDIATGICSYQTPLALALLGKTLGDTAMLKLDGPESEYEIIALGNALES